jgi:hypothetical protein
MDLSRFIYSSESSDSSLPRDVKASLFTKNSSTFPDSSSRSSSNSPPFSFSLQKKRKLSPAPPSIPPDEKLSEIGLQELYATPGKLELPLNLLIIGHNPSDTSWKKGHYYANPSNRMWPLLIKSQLVPSTYRSSQDFLCPFHCKIGFTDLIIHFPETNSQKFTHEYLHSQRISFYSRLIQHCQRVEKNLRINRDEISEDEKDPEGCNTTPNDPNDNSISRPSEESPSTNNKYSPKIIAFSGIRQWKALFPLTSREYKKDYRTRYGIQKILPPDWPKELSNSLIYLLPTTSGAAPMTTTEREDPYLELGKVMRSLERHESLDDEPKEGKEIEVGDDERSENEKERTEEEERKEEESMPMKMIPMEDMISDEEFAL